MLHAPEFLVNSTKFQLELIDDTKTTFDLPKYISSLKPYRLFNDPNNMALGDYLERVSIETDMGEPPTIKFNSALGLPSMIMLYTEFADVVDVGDNKYIHGAHPRIDSLRIQLFNQDVPIVKNLSSSELRYITQKNAHPNYMKETEFSDPIVLLDLESLGLGKDLPGYPSRDRVSAEISLTSVTLPGMPKRQYATEAVEDGMIQSAYTIVDANGDANIPPIYNPGFIEGLTLNFIFKCVFIYENRVVEGNVNQMKINRKY